MGSTTGTTPLDPAKTVRLPGRSRRMEVWIATSVDGRWTYGREEDTGTTWTVRDNHADRLSGEWFSSLAAARRWTAEQSAAVTA